MATVQQQERRALRRNTDRSNLSHEAKVAIAKRLRTQRELIQRIGIFETVSWDRRKARIAKRVKKVEAIQKFHKERRAKERAEAQA